MFKSIKKEEKSRNQCFQPRPKLALQAPKKQKKIFLYNIKKKNVRHKQ